MDKVDFKKTLPSYKAKSGTFEIVTIPEAKYLMIDGQGDPNKTPEYTNAIQALYPLAYKLKFASKEELGRDYVVMPLEGLWWASDMDSFTSRRDKSKWFWTLMIMVPDWITEEMFLVAQAVVAGGGNENVYKVRIQTLTEGICVQTLHVGPFDDEAATLKKLHENFVPSNRLRMTGRHHEIYLSDIRRVDPAKYRTILRQPVIKI